MQAEEAAQRQLVSERRQMRRAWTVIALATLAFIVAAAAVVWAARYYYVHATVKESAVVRVISGSGALWRTSSAEEWRLIDQQVQLNEGNQISTALGTTAWVTLFDGSTVEISEDSVITLARSRSSRFLDRTKDIVIEVERGSVYIAMAPHGDYRYSRIKVDAGFAYIDMSDEPGRSEAGSYLVEVRPSPEPEEGAISSVRLAVLRGAAIVQSGEEQMKLRPDEQIIVKSAGELGAVMPAVRELILNGDFTNGLAGWLEVHDSLSDSPSSGAGIVELRPELVAGEPTTALELVRSTSSGDAVMTGVRQRIGQSLRVYSSLQLTFDLKINSHGPVVTGPDGVQLPFVVELNFIDLTGQERTWRHGYFLRTQDGAQVDQSIATPIDRGAWFHVNLDLNNLDPLPKQIVSLVVYALGTTYQCFVANLSLTSSEQPSG